MKPGLLRHPCFIYRQIDEQSESGAVSQVRKLVCSLRCQLMKQSGYYTQNNIEQADKMTIVFQTWIDDRILDTDTLVWSNQEFRIFLIEKDIMSKTMKLHVQKIIK